MKAARLLALPLAAAAMLAATAPAAAGPFVTNRVINYHGPVEHCVRASERTFERFRIRIDNVTPGEVFATDPGYTIGVRCDVPGTVFLYGAFSDNAPRQARQRFMDDLRVELARQIGGGPGGGGRY